MKYSIIIPYRNREQHLQTLLPRLIQKFEGKDYEILVVEQDDNEPFCKTVLMNKAAEIAVGDILIFHDVDYYPTDNVSYDYDEDVGIYPVRNVIFLDENGNEMPNDRIPGGYKMFKYDVGNHSGGVVIVSKKNFYRMNGFNPSYRGWGKEDDDFLTRFDYHHILRRRNENGTFLGLYHRDSAPKMDDKNFLHNNQIISDFLNTYWMGPANTSATVNVFDVDSFKGKWIKITNCKMVSKTITLTLPTRGRVKSLDRTLQAIKNTVDNPSELEAILRIDSDDTDTLAYVRNTSFPFDVVQLVKPQDAFGYNNIGIWHDQMSQIARGKLLMWYGDDCVPSPKGWDTLATPFQNEFGVINTGENESAPFNVVFFYTIKLYRTMQWLGTHPYNDRWFNEMCKKFPALVVGKTQMHSQHIKDNPHIVPPGAPALHPVLSKEQEVEWNEIFTRVERHLKILGR